jgi:aryl-alcohol dehydrogenase-like predicted oxidoreductase
LLINKVNKMKYVNLGKSGLKVSQIILGCMSYGVKRPADKWTWVLEEEEAMKHLKVSFSPLVHERS